MIAHSQPIALPAQGTGALAAGMGSSTGGPADYAMHDVGSYPASSDGAFNPASFTRHFLGSPISWRAASWGMSPSSRIPAGSPTAHLLSSIE
jgi:transcription factor SFP1